MHSLNLLKSKALKFTALVIRSLVLSTLIVATFTKIPVPQIWAASVSWVGGTDANWSTAANWSTGVVPTADDDVLINVSATINLASSTTVNTLVLGNSGGTTIPILNFSYNAITNGALTVDGGNLHIYSGGKITHTVGTGVVVGAININVTTGDLIIDAGGSIDTTGKGYAGGAGTGAGVSVSNSYGAGGGGGYGATGGAGTSGYAAGGGGISFGSINNPTDLGGSGGRWNSDVSWVGSGGGVAILTVSGEFQNNGNIYASGNNGTGSYYNGSGGGGAGGSVNITTNSFTGNGNIIANGGTGYSGYYAYSGGGAGGRIAITYATKTFTGSLQSKGGQGAQYGGAGSILTKAVGTNGDLLFDNTGTPNVLDTKGYAKITTTETFDTLTIRNLAIVEISSTVTVTGALSLATNSYLRIPATANVTYGSLSWAATIIDNGGAMSMWASNANITIPAGATYIANTQRTFNNIDLSGIITHFSNSSAETYKINLTANGYFKISSTGSININGKGFSGGAGTGAGGNTTVDSKGGGGGGYGAAGGVGSGAGGAGGASFGSISNPVNLGGSGGYTANAASSAGAGGGAVILTINGEFQNNGNIYANGNNGSWGGHSSFGGGGGGGAGGSVNITSNSFTGNGNIVANGGAGFSNYYSRGGGGGGGRISVITTTNDYTGTFSRSGGAGNVAGGTGTLYPNVVLITNPSASSITFDSATINADISTMPLTGVTDTGFYWGTAPETINTQISLGASNDGGIRSSNLTGLTPLTTYYFKGYAVYGGVPTYSDVASFSTLTDNEIPTALDTNITGETDIYSGKAITLQSVYSDTDGAVDLDKLYLQINNPSGTNIEYYATSAGSDQTEQTPTTVSGAEYLSNITYDIDFEAPTANDVTVTWHITPNWTWTRDTNITYGVKSVDLEAAESIYDYTTNTYKYENRLTFTGAITAIDSESNAISEGSWTPANQSITFSGIKVVYSGTTDVYPDDSSFDVKLINDETTEWFDNVSSGENISINATTANNTNSSDAYVFSIINIPTGGSDSSNSAFTLKTDNTIPTISSLTSTTHPVQTTWYTSTDVTMSWTTADNQSGLYKVWKLIDQTETQSEATILFNGTEILTSGSEQINLATDGTWYYHLVAMDNEGLTQSQTYKINLDTQSPTNISISSTTHPNQASWYTAKSADIAWSSTDTGSGITGIWKLLDQNSTRTVAEVLANGTQALANTTWTTPELSNGIWVLHLVAKDNTDKTTYAKYTLQIDSTTPDIVAITGDNNGIVQNINSGPVISWTDPASISDDIFYITNDGSIPTSTNYIYTTTSNTYDLPNQKEGETIISVKAQNGANTYSEIRTFVIRYDSTAPANANTFVATPVETSINLSWRNPTASDFNKVIILRSGNHAPISLTDGTKIYEGSSTSYSDTNLNENTKYYYTIFALDNIGNRSSGAIAQATTSIIPPVVVDPVTPPVTEDTNVVKSQDLEEGKKLDITVDEQTALPTSSGNLHVYSEQLISISVPAKTITDATDDLKQVVLVLDNQTYNMEYDSVSDTYKTTVNAPAVKGAYDTRIQAISNDNKNDLTITISLLVDPYGYVYTKTGANEVRILNAKISLYTKKDGVEILWQSKEGQINPQYTNQQGEYQFFVEPGEYKLVAEAEGYISTETEWFTVESNIIEKNIEMTKNPYLWFGIIAAVEVVSGIAIFIFLKRKRKLSRKNV